MVAVIIVVVFRGIVIFIILLIIISVIIIINFIIIFVLFIIFVTAVIIIIIIAVVVIIIIFFPHQCSCYAFVANRLDYCSSLYAGLPACRLGCLDRVLRSAARLIGGIPKFGHVSKYMLNVL